MAKYKVGDKVRVRGWDDMAKEYGIQFGSIEVPWMFTQDMKEYCGRVVTIKKVVEKAGYHPCYFIEEDNGKHPFDAWKFSEGMFEPEVVKDIKPKNPSIVIYRKDNKVIAIDKSTGKTAEAICSEDDEFDFYTGADLAFERLRGRKPAPKAREDAPKFYSGDIVCVKSMTSSFTKGKIYKVRNGKITNINNDDECCRRFKSFDEINRLFASQFIELIK